MGPTALETFLMIQVMLSFISALMIMMIFITPKETRPMYMLCPSHLYRSTKLNVFGVMIIFILLLVPLLTYYAFWFVYWLFHVGRKK